MRSRQRTCSCVNEKSPLLAFPQVPSPNRPASIWLNGSSTFFKQPAISFGRWERQLEIEGGAVADHSCDSRFAKLERKGTGNTYAIKPKDESNEIIRAGEGLEPIEICIEYAKSWKAQAIIRIESFETSLESLLKKQEG